MSEQGCVKNSTVIDRTYLDISLIYRILDDNLSNYAIFCLIGLKIMV